MKTITPKLLLISPKLGIALLAALILTGCTATINADGSKSATLDGEAAARAFKIIAEK